MRSRTGDKWKDDMSKTIIRHDNTIEQLWCSCRDLPVVIMKL